MHIPGAIFFSIQEHSDKETDLENMLPKSDYWISTGTRRRHIDHWSRTSMGIHEIHPK